MVAQNNGESKPKAKEKVKKEIEKPKSTSELPLRTPSHELQRAAKKQPWPVEFPNLRMDFAESRRVKKTYGKNKKRMPYHPRALTI